MSIRVAIHHKTEYRYDRLVSLGPHLVRLRPAPHTRTPVHRYALHIEPEEHFINWQQDPFGNFVARLVFPERTRKFSVEVDLIADMVTINPFDFFVDPSATHYPFRYEPQLAKELTPYFETARAGPAADEVSGRDSPRQARDQRLPGRPQPRPAAAHRLSDPHGARGANLRADAGTGQGLVPRQRLAAGADSAPPGAGRALRLRLPGAAGCRREVPGRPLGPGAGLHRPARLDRGLCARCRLDGTRPHLGVVRRRGSHPAGLHPGPGECGADHRRGGKVRDRVPVRKQGHPHPRRPAGHQALQRRAVGGGDGPGRRPGPATWRPTTCA